MQILCVFTGTRADYGLLRPLMQKIEQDPELELRVVASGMHLSPEFGLTYLEIEEDGFFIDEKIEVLLSSDTSTGLAKATGLGLISYSEALDRLQPDCMVLLGDRFELLAMATAAMYARVPIAHIHGGEATYGVVDEAIRHAVTKMSHLHFTSTEEYRQRVIQLGEAPGRVFNVGALGVENIEKVPLLSKKELEQSIGFSLGASYLLVTCHPVTLEEQAVETQMTSLLDALDRFRQVKVIFTLANADSGGRIINRMIEQYVAENKERTIAFPSLGRQRYLSAMKYCAAVVGNSSSGIIEAPSFHVPTVNIGDRQKGRIRARSVVDCPEDDASIIHALHTVLNVEFVNAVKTIINPYARPNTAATIVEHIKKCSGTDILMKEFYAITRDRKDEKSR